MNNVKEWNHEGMLPENVSFGEIKREIPSFSQDIHSLKYTHPVEYLSSIESFVSKELISSQNFAEIKKLANHFTENITSFFGFETRLNNLDARSDYLFAVSSKKGEREALARLLQDENISESFKNQPEWQNVGKFAAAWVNPNSILYNKVLGLWLEFDTAGSPNERPAPCVFISTVPIRIDAPKDIQKYAWLADTALPLLTGKPLSEKMKQRLFDAIQHMPKDSLLFNVGVMLSRSSAGVRLVINRIQSTQIISYLKSLGWTDEQGEGLKLIKELEQEVSRFVLHIGITEDGIDPKIGIECSFYPDRYNLETRWSGFFDYLIKKGLGLPEKIEMLLGFLGVEQEDASHEFSLESYMTAVKLPEKNYSGALVRFISHVKICYKPSHPLEAKAYPGARLFGRPQTNTNYQ